MNENQLDTEMNVDNYQHFKQQYEKIVDDCRQARERAGFNQDFMAQWLGVGRWHIVEFEKKKQIDLKMLCNYAEKLDIEIFLNHQIN